MYHDFNLIHTRDIWLFIFSFFVSIIFTYNKEVDFETYISDIETTINTEIEVKQIIFDGIFYDEQKEKYSYTISEDKKTLYFDERLDITDENSFRLKVITKELIIQFPAYDEAYHSHTKCHFSEKKCIKKYYEIPILNYKEEVSQDLNNHTDILLDEYKAYIDSRPSSIVKSFLLSFLFSLVLVAISNILILGINLITSLLKEGT